MRVVNRRPTFLYLSVVSFYISSFSIAIMPLGAYDIEGNRYADPTILAVMFWAGIILGLLCTWRVTRQRKWDNKYNPEKTFIPPSLCFFSNKFAKVFDTILIVGASAIVMTSFISFLPNWVIWELLFLTVFSLEMHFIFNGENYKWLKTPPAAVPEEKKRILR